MTIRGRRMLAALALAVAPAACGPEAVLWVRVEAPLSVPEECDGASVTVRPAGVTTEALFEKVYDLSTGPRFPLTLALEAGEHHLAGGGLDVVVEAQRGGQRARAWAVASGTVSLRGGGVTELVLQMCDCPPARP